MANSAFCDAQDLGCLVFNGESRPRLLKWNIWLPKWNMWFKETKYAITEIKHTIYWNETCDLLKWTCDLLKQNMNLFECLDFYGESRLRVPNLYI